MEHEKRRHQRKAGGDDGCGFAIQFQEKLEPALLDYLCAVRMEEAL